MGGPVLSAGRGEAHGLVRTSSSAPRAEVSAGGNRAGGHQQQ